jgi:pimeloyl-ACP methyl ester carboxylesterase
MRAASAPNDWSVWNVSLTPSEVAQRSYHDPATFGIDPTTLPPQAQELMAGNRAALATYGGTAMTDPTLAPRLQAVSTPTLVVWGDSDRIGDPDFGRAYAAAIPGARFQLLKDTGHMPQIETPDQLMHAIWDWWRGGRGRGGPAAGRA